MTHRSVSPHDVCEIIVEGVKRAGKSGNQIVRETGLNKETWRNIKRKRHATNAAVFIEFFRRYPEVRDVIDEYLDLKTMTKAKQKTPSEKLPNVSARLPLPHGEAIRL